MSWDDSPVFRVVFAVAGLGRVEWADTAKPTPPKVRTRGAAREPGTDVRRVPAPAPADGLEEKR